MDRGTRPERLALVHCHAHKPPREFVEIVQPRQIAVQPYQAFLQHLVGIVVIAQDREDIGVQLMLHARAQVLERIEVTLLQRSSKGLSTAPKRMNQHISPCGISCLQERLGHGS